MTIIEQITVNKIMLNKAIQKKMIVEANINEVDYLIDEVLEMNMFVIFKVNLIIQS